MKPRTVKQLEVQSHPEVRRVGGEPVVSKGRRGSHRTRRADVRKSDVGTAMQVSRSHKKVHCGTSSPPGAGALSKCYEAVKGEVKFLSGIGWVLIAFRLQQPTCKVAHPGVAASHCDL